tara:strand:- start:534 stop:767 length:234 start_codon:yes stop_codon:yes gene_type:complete
LLAVLGGALAVLRLALAVAAGEVRLPHPTLPSLREAQRNLLLALRALHRVMVATLGSTALPLIQPLLVRRAAQPLRV